jgi:YesN/AraC family two-component response regulator
MKMSTDFPEELCLAHADLQKEYEELELFSLPQCQSIAALAEILISHILTENMLNPDSGEIVPKAVAYIQDHLEDDLSIQKISRQINASKSVLYKKFQTHFHCTVGEYINKKRVERAVQLLTTTALSMEDISQKCGFSSGSYFTKIFKQNMGVTPLKFKKNLP